MFTLPRSQIRQFRAVLRRAGIGKQLGGFRQRFVIAGQGDHYALQAMSADVAIELRVSAACDRDRIVLPLDMLVTCESRSDNPAHVRWPRKC